MLLPKCRCPFSGNGATVSGARARSHDIAGTPGPQLQAGKAGDQEQSSEFEQRKQESILTTGGLPLRGGPRIFPGNKDGVTVVSTRTTHHKCDFQRTWEIIRANVPENWSGQQTRNRPRAIKDGTNQVFHEPTRSSLGGLCQMLAGQ